MSKKNKTYADGSPMPGGESLGDTTAPSAPAKVQLTPRQRFVKHAGRRTSQLLKKMQYFGNMAARTSYGWTDAERDEMLQLVDDAYKSMRARFFPVPGAALAARSLFSWERANGDGAPA